jgi:DNA replication protein DnaC
MTLPTLSPEGNSFIDMCRATNKKLILKAAETPRGGCTNCNGLGIVWFQTIEAGPFQSPPGNRDVITWIDNAWYKVDDHIFPCPCCTDRESILRHLWNDSGLEKQEQSWTLEYLERYEGKAAAVTQARQILSQLPMPKGWTVFYGEFGVGKSGLLKSIVAASIRAGISARYCTTAKILSQIRSSYSQDEQVSEEELIREYASYPILAIDEFDSMSKTEWAQSVMKALIDVRHRRAKFQVTLFATNVTPDNLPDEFGYLRSRMQSGEIIQVEGIDLRKQGNQEEYWYNK